jgi:hypothetical protein
MSFITKAYSKFVENAYRVRGIRIDDYLPPDADVLGALRLLSPDQKQARQRRILRHIDLGLKHVELSPIAQQVQQPFKSYGLFELATDLKKRRIERETYQ